jgi:succinyl-diaminopimelate desuccinylase
VTAHLDLDLPGPDLAVIVCDIESVSGNETALADAIELALAGRPHLEVTRRGDTVVARTDHGRSERAVVAGHIDTVPVTGNLPVRRQGTMLWGRGTVDMKGGVAVALRLAAHVRTPSRDVTYVWYDNEEVESDKNGLGRIIRTEPGLLAGDFAILMEPTSTVVEGGCNGTMRLDVVVPGRAAHSARWWMGTNAIHAAGEVLDRLRRYRPADVAVEGLVYREGLSAVGIAGGIAGNVIPDRCVVSVNYRFAPSRTEAEAETHVREVFDGFDVVLTDSAPGARPGLNHPAAVAFAGAVGGTPRAKQGWTDVARFTALGMPALNYGPGDPQLAHHDDEHVDVREIEACEQRMREWLGAAG